MGCKTETKVINDVEYSVTQWDATTAFLKEMELMAMIGPAFDEIATLALESGDEAKQTQSVAKGISVLFSKNDPKAVVTLVQQCIYGVASSKIENRQITATNFNQAFDADTLMDMHALFFFVLKVNFSSFFKGQLVKDMGALLAKSKSPLTKGDTPT